MEENKSTPEEVTPAIPTLEAEEVKAVAPPAMVKITIQEIEIEIPANAMDRHLGQSIVLLNVLGKSYWNEWKKIFKLPEPAMGQIKAIFENE